MNNSEKTMDKIVALCKNRGFVYPGSEIYGGLANTWDYGPLGVELKTNIKNAWRKKFIQENKYNVGLDSAILMNPQTWVASGHIGGFSDPLMDCKDCKTRHRADNLIEDFDGTNVAGWTNEQMMDYIKEKQNRKRPVLQPRVGKHQKNGYQDNAEHSYLVCGSIHAHTSFYISSPISMPSSAPLIRTSVISPSGQRPVKYTSPSISGESA